ncbi:recombinase family protein [Arthrobacter gyeryongensis]|uniref:Recombinase family protein n=1 Tax=Arthrobacter gyeryongensis TaxID=1650592 RepID=A0ABP9SSX3_9MICC
MSAPAVYVRQSEDKTGHAAAVQRQEADCRLMAQAKGWASPVLYADNSISATSGKTRPDFERLLADVERGTITRIVVWHLDRLTRSMKDLTRLIEAGQKHRVNIACVQGTSLDLGDPTGVAVAQILTAIAAMEVKHKGERQRSANEQRANRGEAFWTRRPFGYDRAEGRVFVVEAEAEAIRSGAQAVLSGATLSSVAAAWNALGLVTTYSKRGDKDAGQAARGGLPWNVTSVRRVFINPRYSGKRLYNGEEMTTGGQWEAILDEDISRRLEELLTDPRRRTAPDDLNSKYLLSGIAVCGKCGAKMFAAPVPAKGGGKRMVYRCFGGYCMQRSLKDLDGLVEELVIGRLSLPDAAKLFARSGNTAELRKKATDLRDRRDALASMLADGLMSPAAVREQAGKLTKELGEVAAAISVSEGLNPAASVVGAADVAKAWGGKPLGNQRQIIRALMDITVLPAGKGRGFSPEQVKYEWKS